MPKHWIRRMAVKNGLLEVIADDAEVPTKAKDSDDAVHGIIGGLLTIKSRGSNDDESQIRLEAENYFEDTMILDGQERFARGHRLCIQ